jgi:lipid A 4'-phosphatase
MDSDFRRRFGPPEPEPEGDAKAADEGMDTRLIWAGLFFSIALFAEFPGLDLLISAHYYSPQGGFVHRQDPVVMALYNWTPWIGRGLLVVMAVFAMAAPALARRFDARGREAWATACRGAWRHAAVVALCSALVGPGIVIEGVLKNTVGRPRPVQVAFFGGTQAYQGPLALGPDPGSHKSFVSSHAAAGFALMGLGLTCGAVWRRRWFLIGTVTGSAVGLGRVMQGGHFFSDILFAFYAVWLSCELVAWIDRKRMARHAPPPRRRRM